MSDFVITNTYSKANYAVKSVTVDATDKTKVTIETYVAMADGKDYTITFDGVTKDFTATDGKVVSATITPATVVVPTPANNSDGTNANDIKVTFTDAAGVKIMDVTPTTAASGTKPNGFSYVEIKVDATNNGYISGNTLTLYKAGNTAKVSVVAHTGNYDATAQEVGNITAEATITGVDATAVTTTGWNVKIAKGLTGSNKEFKDVTESNVAVNDTGIVAFVQRTTSDNKATSASDYTFESSNKDIMNVVKTGTPTVKDATAVEITPYKTGTAYIIVKDSQGTVITTLPVTIGEARKAATLTLDKNNITLSGADGIDSTVTIKATIKDQYGADYSGNETLTYVKATDQNVSLSGVSGKEITVAKPALVNDKDTSVTYIVKYGNLRATFVITVKKAEAAVATYALELSADSVDAIVKADAKGNTTVTAKVCGYDKNGVKVNDSVDATYKLTKDGNAATDAAGSSTSSTIQINNVATGKQMANGTYLVTATAEGKTFTKTFTVTNTQPQITVSRVKETGASVAECFEVKYEGNVVSDVTFYDASDADVTNATETVAIAKVVAVANVGTNKVEQTVNVGLTVTIQ